MQHPKCSQFDSKGSCQHPAEVISGGWTVDFCAMHNHMNKTGIPVKCHKCGDR